ncbi:MAG: hypothetical protein C4535_13035 [Comamonadaceae bacterium]|nr:MAG: hypothetical protein C4535_13035 [Comamonadaceae bacterium]
MSRSPCFRASVLALMLALQWPVTGGARELPAVAPDAAQAVRAAQKRPVDPAVRSLNRQLRELRDPGAQITPAKRQELRTLRAELSSRLAESATARQSRGDAAGAEAMRQWRNQMIQRFATLDAELDATEGAAGQASANAGNRAARASRLQERLAEWNSRRPVAPIPGPNWQQVELPPLVEQAPAAEPPRFVSDIMWLYRKQHMDANGMMRVALQPTPAEAASCDYTAADLAETPEVPSTNAEVLALAASLDHNPARIYAWVNQNIQFEPYFGSLKGGLSTLWGKAGGATDQASLLIALLRASNIPARYVRGTVRVLDAAPLGAESRGARWVGAKTTAAAARILASNGNPAANSGTDRLGLAHVWVQACLPYGAYRGAGIDASGHRWVPLDPSFKEHRYSPGIVVDGSFDFNYATWLSSRIDPQGRYRLPQEQLVDEAQAHVRSKPPRFGNNTAEDIPYKSEIDTPRFDVLPIVPPYDVLSYDSWSGLAGGSAETAALPDRHRYRLQVTVRNKSAAVPENFTGNVLAQKTLNLTQLATGKLTLAFRGLSAADQTAYTSWLNGVNPDNTPTCSGTTNVVPVLRLDGIEQVRDSGSGSTTLCSGDNVLQMQVTLAENSVNPVRSSTSYQTIAGANLHALHAYAWHTSDVYLAKRAEKLLAAVRATANPNASEESRDATEGEFLALAASRYSRYTADATREAGGVFGESGTSGISLGLTSAQVKINYLFDLPYGISRKGFLIDWPGSISTSTRLDGATGDWRGFKLAGFAGSAYESFIWQEMAGLDAVSTTRGLQFAREQGIEVLQIDDSTQWAAQKSKLTTNTNSTLNYLASQVAQIESTYVNQGFKLTIPRSLIEYPGWKGSAFYAERFTPTTGQAGFPISTYSGGVTVEAQDDEADEGGAGGTGPGGSASGGFTGGSAPIGGAYNPTLGTGYIVGSTAPTFAQQSGQNSYQTANGLTAGTTYSGDPVNMVTGNLIHSERDISIKGRGGLPIVFERWYNSKNPKDGPLGFGWTHSFNHSIRFYGVEAGVAKLAWVDGTGGERFFSTTGHTSGNVAVGAAFTAPAGVYATVQRLPSGQYAVTERSGMRYVFESVNGTATDTNQKARLLSISDRNNNTLNLSYSAACGNQLCTVTDALSRSLTFSYTGTRINQITDWNGRTWRYTVDAAGDLVSFSNPLAVAGSQPPVTYQYLTSADGAPVAHAMKRYQLPRGNGMQFEYYANGRVFHHTPFGVDSQPITASVTTFTWAEFRREAVQIDGAGRERRFLFDAHGNPLSITDETGATTSYTYDPTTGRTHLRTSRTTDNGQTTQYAYDANGHLTDVTMPSARTVQYRDHNVYGQAQREKDANGNWTLRRFDAAGNLTDLLRTRAGVVPTAGARPATTDIVSWNQFQSDGSGNPTLVRRLRDWSAATLGTPTSGVGPALETTYDTNRLNVVGITRRGDLNGSPASLETESYTDFQYDPLGRPLRSPDASWYPQTNAWDALDRPTESPDGRGNAWATVFDANGNPLFVGLTVGGAYVDGYYANWDDLDRLERRVDYAGNATLNRYNGQGHLLQRTGADGYTLGFENDALGRVLGAFNEENHRVLISRDGDGRERSVTDPNGLTTAFEYHDATEDGRLKRTSLPPVSGQAASRAMEVAQYDGLGKALRMNSVAADGSVRDTRRFFDELGRLTREVGPAVSATDTSRPVSCWVYSALDDVREVWAGSTTDATNPTCTFTEGPSFKRQLTQTHDDWGRLLSRTDALGRTWRWSWNIYGQLVSSQSPVQAAASQSTTYQYGTAGTPGQTQGLLRSRTVPGTGAQGQSVTYTRDVLGQVTKAETRDGSGALVVTQDTTYDAARRVISTTDTRPASSPKTLQYSWTPGGRLARVQDSDGHSLSYTFDAVGRLASIVAPNNETISFVWDAGGRLQERRLGSGLRSTQTWFEDGNLKEQRTQFNATTLTSHQYGLDAQGRRTTHAESIGGATKNWVYQHDNLDRLSSANDGSNTESYGYDIWGNRRSKASGAGTTAYLYDAAHQLSEMRSGSDTGALVGAAVHDADGHLIKLCEGGTVSKSASDCTGSGGAATTLAMTWNALDQLLNATRTGANPVVESHLYDDQNRRIRSTSAGISTSNLYSGDAIHAQWSGATLGAAPNAVTVHGAATDEPVLRLTGNTNGTTATQAAYLQDGLGSVVGTVNPAGTLTASQRFDAWGVKVAGTGAVPQYGFTGREPDASGLVYYRARYYHPGIGRFTSRDPMGMVDAVSGYAYVGSNPVNAIDPYGLMALDPVKVAGLGGLGNYWSAAEQMGSNIYSALPSRQSINNFLDKTQTTLDYAGLAAQGPAEVVAPFIDAASALTSVVRGDYAGAGLSALGAVPFVGSLANAGKVARGIDSGTDAARIAPSPGNTTVYQSVDGAGNVNYVGITDNFSQRAAAQLREKGISINPIDGLQNISRTDARAVEQAAIEMYGLGKNGGLLMNKINSIAPSNPIYPAAIERGNSILRSLGN